MFRRPFFHPHRGFLTTPASSAVVYALLEEITLRPRGDFRSDVRLGRDLRVNHEAYTLRLIPELERRLGIHPSQLEWSQVETVHDLLGLAHTHANRATFVVQSPRPAV